MTVADFSVGAPEATEVATPALDANAGATWLGEPDLADAPEVSEDLVRSVLKGLSKGLALVPWITEPDLPELWVFTDDELDDLTPPVTRIANRRPALRQALAEGDELAVAVHLAGYGMKNETLRRLARADRLRQEQTYGDDQREAGSDRDGAPGADQGVAGHGFWAAPADGAGGAPLAPADR